jgi:serine/threonine-protein kinase
VSVAIKVLPDALAADVERLGRLQREAEVLASLNHPHIAQIYGLEKSDPSTGSGHAIVMEFVDGVTLADRIAQGPLPIEDAVAIAKQIAEALEAAHEQGIVHRDLKPANVKLRPDGQAKVLDFGLAKLAMGEAALSSPAALTASPTLTVHATFLGVILGTAGYMSPEQAKGKVVDRRADIWAFGVVLCEMLTGRRMYDGETAAETLARIIEREPDLSALPAATPATVRTVLERCLTKDPRARLQAIGEARILLERAIAQPRADERANVPASDEPRRTQTATAAWVFAGLLAVALAAAIVLWAPVEDDSRTAVARQGERGHRRRCVAHDRCGDRCCAVTKRRNDGVRGAAQRSSDIVSVRPPSRSTRRDADRGDRRGARTVLLPGWPNDCLLHE